MQLVKESFNWGSAWFSSLGGLQLRERSHTQHIVEQRQARAVRIVACQEVG